MEIFEVEQIFKKVKDVYLDKIPRSTTPTAYILGGQPSSGKSTLDKIIENRDCVLVINGDLYRGHHPKNKELLKDVMSYSEKTQIFSNVFTERLIEESIKRRLSVSVEGTMRRSEVVKQTVDVFKNANYRVELVCIAAPKEFTAINLFHRYAGEIQFKGTGRLADINSHDEACGGLLATLDDVYTAKIADRIRLYDIFGRALVADYQNKNGHWNISTKPSEVVLRSRTKQLADSSLGIMFVKKGIDALAYIQEQDIRNNLQTKVKHLLHHLQKLTIRPQQSQTTDNASILDEIDRLTYGVEYLKNLGIDTFWKQCKEYNDNTIFKQHRKHTGKISISQAFRMALDHQPIKSTNVTLDALKVDSTYQLSINGKTLNELIDETVHQTKSLKR